VNSLKRVRSVCLGVLCLMSVFALGVVGSASASSTLLFEPASGVFPYHLAGLLVAEGRLETIKGKKVKSTAAHVLIRVLNQTLFHVHILFLGVKAEELAPCSNLGGGSTSGHILIELLGHLGYTHDSNGNNVPAVLLLVPNGFSFECEFLGVKSNISVRGSVIGLITHPKPLVSVEELGVVFEQSAGVQKHTLFLLPGGVVMSDQLLESAENGGTFEQAGEEIKQTLLKALPNEGKFLLRDE